MRSETGAGDCNVSVMRDVPLQGSAAGGGAGAGGPGGHQGGGRGVRLRVGTQVRSHLTRTLELETEVQEVFTMTEKAPIRACS